MWIIQKQNISSPKKNYNMRLFNMFCSAELSNYFINSPYIHSASNTERYGSKYMLIPVIVMFILNS